MAHGRQREIPLRNEKLFVPLECCDSRQPPPLYTAEVTQLHSPESSWRWRNPAMQHSSFLGASWAFRMYFSRSWPNQRMGCSFQQAALPNPLETGIANKQFQGNKHTEANSRLSTRTNTTHGWQGSVQQKPPQGFNILLPIAAGNLDLARRQSTTGTSTILEGLKQSLSLHPLWCIITTRRTMEVP